MSNYEKLTKEQKEEIELSIKQTDSYSGKYKYKGKYKPLYPFFVKVGVIAFSLVCVILYFLKLKTFI